MSISASFTVKLKSRSQKKLSPKDIIVSFISKEWRIHKEKKVLFLPLGENDFDWQYKSISIQTLLDIVDKKNSQGEVSGVLLYWKNTNIGIHLIFHSSYDLTILLNVNRKQLNCYCNEFLTDLNWYVERIMPALDNDNYLVETFSYDEYR